MSRSEALTTLAAPAVTTRLKATPFALPTISWLLLRWFTWYSRRYLRRHFHAVRISRAGLPPATNLPMVLYSNHASWWDPLVGLVLKAEYFANRDLFAPMDATMLRRYKMFGKMGFFGVDQTGRKGGFEFLRAAEAVLESPRHILAVTPQARLADARERPVSFAPGLGHLARRVQRALFVPVAVEYAFWDERLPEALLRFGEPSEILHDTACRLTADEWTRRLELSLESTQDALALESQRRNPAAFEQLCAGGAGQGGVYDAWQAVRATLRGEKFQREHGRK